MTSGRRRGLLGHEQRRRRPQPDLGAGIAFSPRSGRVDLELVEHEVTGSVVSLRYRVTGRR
ncbi:hypothetical protein [Nocardioides taihuensis]|uniref:Uncharacterized protein n=1 Tax=Nocardioides taihuensis TaxID=1835606 RepID=A0ABW0BP51_9ACTN